MFGPTLFPHFVQRAHGRKTNFTHEHKKKAAAPDENAIDRRNNILASKETRLVTTLLCRFFCKPNHYKVNV